MASADNQEETPPGSLSMTGSPPHPHLRVKGCPPPKSHLLLEESYFGLPLNAPVSGMNVARPPRTPAAQVQPLGLTPSTGLPLPLASPLPARCRSCFPPPALPQGLASFFCPGLREQASSVAELSAQLPHVLAPGRKITREEPGALELLPLSVPSLLLRCWQPP